MASSKVSSIRKAQIPSQCHLCEENPDIQWKCVDCNLLMCGKCKMKVHSKFKSADEHYVINLKDIGNEQRVESNLQNIPCKLHRGQKICLYCKNCHKLACPDCVSDTHTKHDLENLSKIYERKINSLKYLRDELNADLLYFERSEKKLENQKTSERNVYEAKKQAIIQQKEEIKRAVDTEAEKNLQKLERSWVQAKSSISSVQTNILKTEQEMKSKISSLEAILNENNIEAIINEEQSLFTSINSSDISIRNEYTSRLEFHPGEIDLKQIAKMMGSLQKVPEAENIRFNKVQSYKSGLFAVTHLLPCRDGHVLTSDEQISQSMTKIKFDGKSLEEIKTTKGIRIYDMTEIQQNDFIVSFIDKTMLKRLKSDGTFEDFLNFSPLLPRALHFTKSGKLLISVREDGVAFPTPSSSQRKLIVMEATGKQIHQYHLGDQEKELFSLVGRVTTAVNNEIFLLDWTSFELDGSVVALQYPNKIVWRYNGHEHINTDSTYPFRPSSIATTDTVHVIVSDFDNSVIHILNINGSLKTFVDTKSYDILYPYYLAIDSSGLLWIGCTTEKTNPTNAMLHVVKFSGV